MLRKKQILTILVSLAVMLGAMGLPAFAEEAPETSDESSSLVEVAAEEELPQPDESAPKEDEAPAREEVPASESEAEQAGAQVPPEAPPEAPTPEKPQPELQQAAAPVGLPVPAANDFELEERQPLLEYISVVTEEAEAPGEVVVEIELAANGTDLAGIGVNFDYYKPNGQLESKWCFTSAPEGNFAAGGRYEIIFDLDETWPEAEYSLDYLYLASPEGETRYYSLDSELGKFVDTRNAANLAAYGNLEFSVADSARTDSTAPKVLELELLDDEVTSPGTLRVRLHIVEEGVGLSYIRLGFTFMLSENSSMALNAWHYFDEPLNEFDDVLEIQIEDNWPQQEVYFDDISVCDRLDNSALYAYSWDSERYENWYDSTDYFALGGRPVIMVTDAKYNDTTTPLVTGLRFAETTVYTPGMFTVEIDIVEAGSGVRNLRFELADAAGYEIEYYEHLYSDPLFTGTHEFTFPVGLRRAQDRYTLRSVYISDVLMYTSYYYDAEQGLMIDYNNEEEFAIETASMEIIRDPNYNLVVDLDENLAEVLDELEDGETALVAFDGYGEVEEDVFQTILDKDLTLVFYDESSDTQWTFEGSDIIPERIGGPLRLSLATYPMEGEWLGFEDDVVTLLFPDNGLLPGPATIRVRTSELLAMHRKAGDDPLVLTYDNNGVLEVEPSPVVLEEGYSVFTIDHNSSFYVSLTEADDGGGDDGGDSTTSSSRPEESSSSSGSDSSSDVVGSSTSVGVVTSSEGGTSQGGGSDSSSSAVGPGSSSSGGADSSSGVNYAVLEGNGASYTGKGGLEIRSEGDFAKFQRLRVNGKDLIRGVDFLAREGSTIITLLDDYLATLATGTYELQFVFEDGTSFATFTVAASESAGAASSGSGGSGGGSTAIAATGDNSNTALYLTLALLMVVALALGLVLRRRQRNR